MRADRFGFRRDSARQKTRILAEAPTTQVDGGVATMRLFDPIDSWGEFWGVSAKEFVGVLDELPGNVTEIRLHINSPGGEVWEAVAILNALRAHDARVVVTVDGLAASAASIVSMAGDEIVMARNSEMMVHNVHGFCMGDAADMRDFAEQLERMNRNTASVYADRAGGTVDEWLATMAAETWYSGAEAVEAGLADRVLAKDPDDADKAKNRFDLSIYNHAGRSRAPAPHSPATPQASGPLTPTTEEGSPAVEFTDDQLDTLRQTLGITDPDADGAAFVAALDEALAERAESQVTNTALPEGTVAIDSTTLEGLRVSAQRGEQARAQQEQEGRERLVNAAVADGRIAPARRGAWLNRLSADAGEAETLAGLAVGLVPVAAIGYTGSDDAPANTVEGIREMPTYKNWSF